MNTLPKRVSAIEQRNARKDQQEHDEGIIGVKEVYERLIQVETKLDMNTRDNKSSIVRFTWFVFVLVFLSAVNITLTSLGLRGW